MSTSSDLAGKVLGRCTLEELIGRGGMSTVYRAKQTRPSRYVAVKVLLPNIAMDSEIHNEFLVRFRREANVIAKLEHINIMPIYDYGEQDGLAYLMMPYLTGGTLRDVLERQGTLSLQEAATYVDQAAAALDYAHTHGVIHRDLKPGNFLLHTDGRLVLSDFGIARILSESNSDIGAAQTYTGMVLGTPEYMAPEMALGEEIDHRTDIYELGIVLYHMLSGEPPFRGKTLFAIATKHVQGLPPPLHLTNPAIPPVVDAVVQKALAKQREDRFESAGAMARALRTAISAFDPPSAEERNTPLVLSLAGSTTSATTVPMQETTSIIQPITGDTTQAHDETASQETMVLAQPTPIDPGEQVAPVESSDEPASSELVPPLPADPETPRPTLVHIQQPRPLFGKILPIIIIIVFVASGALIGLASIGIFTGHSQTPISKGTITLPVPTATPSPAQQAQATIQQYYDAINSKDYMAAYNLWGTDYQRTHTSTQFASGFAQTNHDDIAFDNVTPLSDGTIKVTITVYADTQTSSGTVISVFQGYYIVGPENHAWKLQDANFQPTATTLTPSQQAQILIQQYYEDINDTDYMAAYNLWGTDYQGTHTSTQFASGFAHTLHDSIMFDSVTPLSDGTVQVWLTIHTREQTSTGSVTSTFHGYYIVGQEGGTWKLLSANFQ